MVLFSKYWNINMYQYEIVCVIQKRMQYDFVMILVMLVMFLQETHFFPLSINSICQIWADLQVSFKAGKSIFNT